MQFNVRKSAITGFSLVELSAVITIIGITLSGAIDLATHKTESDRFVETNSRMDAIEQALKVFVIKNQRLPCPSDPTSQQGSAGFEVAPTSSGCSASSNLFILGNVYGGMVPTKTLDLDDKYMADDWGRRFTYVVDMQFANNIATNPLCDGTNSKVCLKYTNFGGIAIKTATTGGEITRNAVYVLISHGKNGYGAWPYNGGRRLANSADADEQHNAGDDTGSFDNIFIQKESTTSFDDIVRYSIKSTLTEGIAGSNLFTGITCTAATDAYNHTNNPIASQTYPADPCPQPQGSTPNATTLANCYALATQTYKLCFNP